MNRKDTYRKENPHLINTDLCTIICVRSSLITGQYKTINKLIIKTKTQYDSLSYVVL